MTVTPLQPKAELMSTSTSDSLVYSTLAADPDLGELVEMFLEDIPDRVSTIESSQASGDLESLRRTAHQMKGAAGSYGYGDVTPIAARLEQAIDTGEPEAAIAQAALELVAICNRLRPGTP
jgi:HPt (histidine-containing phosphotransfer) domain-containing protein